MKWASWDFQVRTLSGASAGSEAAVTGNLMAALTGISGVALTRSLNPRQLGKGAVAMSETSHAFVTQIRDPDASGRNLWGGSERGL